MVKYPYFETVRENKMNTTLLDGELFEKQKVQKQERICTWGMEYNVLKNSGFQSLIEKVAKHFDLELDFKIKKGWFFEYGIFKVRGKESQLLAFKKEVENLI